MQLFHASKRLPRNIRRNHNLPTMNKDAKRIIDFWYNRPPLEWIVAPDGLDDTIRSDFGHLVVKAQNKELQSWAEAPEATS